MLFFDVGTGTETFTLFREPTGVFELNYFPTYPKSIKSMQEYLCKKVKRKGSRIR
jgi:hypothetical protein